MKKTGLFAAALAALAGWSAPPVWTLPYMETPPSIDGVIDEAEWARSLEFTGLQLTTGKGLAKEQTRIYLGWDEEHLYLGAYAFDRNVALLHEGPRYDDCIEFFLMKPDSADITHWLLHADGTALLNFVDSQFGGIDHAPGEVKIATAVRPDGWSLEAALPASSWDTAQFRDRFQWRGSAHRSFNHNLSAKSDGRGPEFASFGFILGQYQKPQEFAQVTLERSGRAPVKVRELDERHLRLSAPESARVMVRCDGQDFEAAGENGLFSFTYPEGTLFLEIAVTDGTDLLFANRYCFPGDPAPARAALRRRQMARRGLGVGAASSLERIFPDLPYCTDDADSAIGLEAARNEMEHFQLVLFTGSDPVGGIRIEVSAPEDAAGHVLSAESFSFYRVGTAEAGPVGYPTLRGAGDYPDPLYPLEGALDLAAGSVQPLWGEVKVPFGQTPGIYHGTVTVRAGDGTACAIPLTVEVYDLTIPVRHSLPTAFSLWETPLARRYFDGENADPDRFAEAVDRYAEMLVRHRLTPIIMGTPFLQPEALVRDLAPRLERQEDGSYILYADRFDALVRKYLDLGATGFCVGPYLWGMMREDDRVPDEWPAMWRAVNRHYVENGLAPYAFAYPVDEPGNGEAELTNAMTACIRENAPDIRILLTGSNANFPSQRFSDVDIWVPASHWVNDFQKELEQERGREVWFYPCSGPWYPLVNYHLDTEAAAWRAFAWAAWANRFDGILYWATMFFNWKTPFFNCAHGANGDGLLQYPDENGMPLASTRLKVIADGMEDYEYFVQLRDAVEAGRAAGRDTAAAEQLLTLLPVYRAYDDYSLDSEAYSDFRRRIVEAIAGLR